MNKLLILSVCLLCVKWLDAQNFTPIEIFLNSSISNWSGDLDNDDDTDIVFVGDNGTTDKLYFAEQLSQDVFNVVEQPQEHHILSTIRLGDMDNDSDLDIVIADYDDSVYVYYNEGNFTFSRTQFYVGDWCSDLELFDADQDDTLDIGLASRSENTFVIYENDYTGFQRHDIDNGNSLINKIYAIDVNNDNRKDVYSVGLHGSNGSGTVCRYMNNGGFNFSKSTISSSGEYDITVGLFDADTDFDFITSNSYTGKFKLWENNGGFNYTQSTLHTLGTGWSALATGYADFDQDNDIDFVFGDEESAGLVVYWNMGADVYELDTILVDHDVYEVQVTDYDNDGDADILSASYSHGVYLVKNNLISANVLSIDKSSIKIFPNPSNDIVNIEFDSKFNGSYRLLSLNGQVVDNKEITSSSLYSVQVGNLENGVYLLQLIENQNVRTFQLNIHH